MCQWIDCFHVLRITFHAMNVGRNGPNRRNIRVPICVPNKRSSENNDRAVEVLRCRSTPPLLPESETQSPTPDATHLVRPSTYTPLNVSARVCKRATALPQCAQCLFIVDVRWTQSCYHGRSRVSTCRNTLTTWQDEPLILLNVKNLPSAHSSTIATV